MVIWIKFDHPVHFSSLIPNKLMFTLAISCLSTSSLPWFRDLTFQVPVQCCSLLHQTLLSAPDTSTPGCCFCFGFTSSFLLELFLHSPPAAHWTPTDLGVGVGSHSSVSYLFAFSYYSWGSQGKNAEVVCRSLLQCTTFYQNSLPWPICLGWPNMAWLIVSLSYPRRLWSMWSFWLVFCDCSFRFVCTLTYEDKRLVQASWWEGLGKTGSCSGG